jgi:ABC-type transport system involved in multi-copper enzyme maturation permease subunit
VRQLIWKEWHEQSWKLAFGCIVLSAFAGIGLRTRIILDQEMILWVCMPAMCLLPLLAATGLIPAERSDGTLESLAALPVSLRKIFAVKTMTGLILCAVPLLAAMAVSLAIAGGRELEARSILSLYGRSIFTAIALFIWMLALTIRLPSEARAAMVSIGILMCWSMATAGIWQLQLPLPLNTVSPFSFVLNHLNLDYRDVPVPSLAVNVLVEALIAAALWWCASRAIAKDVTT